MSNPGIYVGIDVGGLSVKVGIREDGKDADLTHFAVVELSDDPRETMKQAHDDVSKLMRNAGHEDREILGVGLITPGPINRAEGTIVEAGNMGVWTGCNIRQIVAEIFKVPVEFANDADGAGYGEARQGAGKGKKVVAGFTLGTGNGFFFIIGGKIFPGCHDSVEGGHVTGYPLADSWDGKIRNCTCGPGKKGCMEAWAGAWAIEERITQALARGQDTLLGERWNEPGIDHIKLVFDEMARSGRDAFAMQIVDEAASALAHGAKNTMFVADAEAFLFVGGITKTGPWFLEKIKGYLTPLLFGPQKNVLISYGSLGSNAGWVGATYVGEGPGAFLF